MPDPRSVSPVATTELYFYADDLDAMTARASAAGATLLSRAADRPWGDRVAYVTDPDGFVIAFAKRLITS